MKQEKLDVLVVEDDQSNLNYIQQIKEKGHNVFCRTSFVEAFTSMVDKGKYYPSNMDYANQKLENIDVLLTDLNLPFCRLGYRESFDTSRPEPLGVTLVMGALAREIPYIGLVTENSHHTGVFSNFVENFLMALMNPVKQDRLQLGKKSGPGITLGKINNSIFAYVCRFSNAYCYGNKNYSAVFDRLLEFGRELERDSWKNGNIR